MTRVDSRFIDVHSDGLRIVDPAAIALMPRRCAVLVAKVPAGRNSVPVPYLSPRIRPKK